MRLEGGSFYVKSRIVTRFICPSIAAAIEASVSQKISFHLGPRKPCSGKLRVTYFPSFYFEVFVASVVILLPLFFPFHFLAALLHNCFQMAPTEHVYLFLCRVFPAYVGFLSSVLVTSL